MNKSLTLTSVFQANSLNYGEGTANISELKKFHRANGEVYSFASRQSIRYDIVRLGNELFGWNLNTVDKASGVIQFRKDVTIADSVEMDLFGYLKTDKESQKRSAVARLSHAISLEPYNSDMEFLNNMGLASRIRDNPNLANIEQHQSLYTYTLTIDLGRVGIDGDIELSKEQRAERVIQLLDILKVLYRDIKGRRENLSPLFVIGGVFDVANPFYMGRIQVEKAGDKWKININQIREAAEITWNDWMVGERTYVGTSEGWLANFDDFKELFPNRLGSVENFFQHLKQEVSQVYGV